VISDKKLSARSEARRDEAARDEAARDETGREGMRRCRADGARRGETGRVIGRGGARGDEAVSGGTEQGGARGDEAVSSGTGQGWAGRRPATVRL